MSPEGTHVPDTIKIETADRIATITLQRPEARNALDLTTLRMLIDTIAWAEADDAVDVMILTGSDGIFCAGLDLKSLSTGEVSVGDETRAGYPWPARTKPLIAAVNGPAITGGLEIVLYCDLAVAAESARFADTHTRVGILPWWRMSVLLPRTISASNATYMSLTGNFIGAEQALAWGLVSQVVPDADLGARARQIATDITGNDQPGVRAMLGLYRDGAGLAEPDAIALEQERAIGWQAEGFDAAEIGRRFEAIKARGRAQRRS